MTGGGLRIVLKRLIDRFNRLVLSFTHFRRHYVNFAIYLEGPDDLLTLYCVHVGTFQTARHFCLELASAQ
jgi:hypothetical protein